jgi:hypothetical protein
MKNSQKNTKTKYSEQKTMKMNSEEKTGHKTKRHALYVLQEEEGDQMIKEYIREADFPIVKEKRQ